MNGAELSLPLPPIWKFLGAPWNPLIVEWRTGAALVLQGKRKGENGLSKWPEWEAVMKISGWCVFQKEAAAHAVQAGSGTLQPLEGSGSTRRKAQPRHSAVLLPHWDKIQCAAATDLQPALSPEKQSRREHRVRASNLCVLGWSS